MSVLLLLVSAIASATPIDVEVCFEFQLSFNDASTGDFWDDNTNRVARGIRYEINDAVQTHTGWASDVDGCAEETLILNSQDQVFNVRARSQATVQGIEMRSYYSDTWETKAKVVAQWNLDAATASTFTVALPDTQVWHNLAVGTWMMNRNTLEVDQDISRDCCLEDPDPTKYLPDGTCNFNSVPSQEYQRIAPPIHMFTDPDPNNPAEESSTPIKNFRCGGSSVEDAGGTDHPALAVGSCAQKYTLAHELGHVIVMMRMGGRTQDPDDAPLDNCMANYRDTGLPLIDPVDPGPGGDRGMLSKEYMSNAFREGWADFVATWAWNKRVEADCVIQGGNFADLDLDGDIDNAQSRLIDCVGTPHVDTAEPASPVMDNINWLDDLETYADVAGCVRDANSTHEANRSTVYDVAKMFFRHVRPGGTLNPDDMSDLYVDMCPRGWSERDSFVNSDELPLERLKTSASHHGVLTDILNKIASVEH